MASAIAEPRLILAIFSCCILLQLSPPVCAKWVKSSIDTSADWTFITRFCFLSDTGGFDFVFKYPKSYGIQQLLLYYDKPGQWEGVYKSSKNCSERVSVLSKANNQIIDLTNRITGSRSAGCTEYTQGNEVYYNCTDSVSFRAARERWWYISLARCQPSEGGKRGLKLDYKIHLTNGHADDYWRYELSADEFWILPTDIGFLIAYIVLLVISFNVAIRLTKQQMFHTTYKMYMTALCLWLFGVFLKCIAWGRYGDTGWEEDPTEVTGRLFEAASTTVFLLMLLLLGKGFTITRGRLTQMSTVRLTIFFCLYVIVNITLFIWEGFFFDEGIVLYFYESPPGYGLIAMRLVAWLWFSYGIVFTLKHHRDKAIFYVPFYFVYTAWFWAGPIVILVAIFSIDKWQREKVVNGVEQTVTLVGYLIFLILTLPCLVGSVFPFHLRTSQVRFSDEEDNYENTYAMSQESRQHVENIFVVDRRPPVGPPSYTMAGRPFGRPGNGSHSNGYVNSGFSHGEQNGVASRPPSYATASNGGFGVASRPPSYATASNGVLSANGYVNTVGQHGSQPAVVSAPPRSHPVTAGPSARPSYSAGHADNRRGSSGYVNAGFTGEDGSIAINAAPHLDALFTVPTQRTSQLPPLATSAPTTSHPAPENDAENSPGLNGHADLPPSPPEEGEDFALHDENPAHGLPPVHGLPPLHGANGTSALPPLEGVPEKKKKRKKKKKKHHSEHENLSAEPESTAEQDAEEPAERDCDEHPQSSA
ncbi:transmembrane protein 145-like [Littorina saxatilis]|uniref:transmembrane protein 145-like n=1 Tax=Littorina saxatilis TaxID=31220 RepID=UPI0038B57B17